MADDHRAQPDPTRTRARLDAIETSYSDAEHDLATVLSRPRLFDHADPTTARFRAELERARHLVSADAHSWTALQAVDDLERSWQRVRDEARRAALSDFSWWQRARIRRAGRLLERARGDRGSPRMRVRDYFRGVQLLDGLLELPAPLRREIHAAAVHTEPLRTPGPDFPTWW